MFATMHVILTLFGYLVLSEAQSEVKDSEVKLESRTALIGTTCAKIQHEVQKAIVLQKWNLENLKFQQRLKKFPKYIVTIQSIQPSHEPLVELRCHAATYKETPTLEFHFHETRFQASSVRLFDIQSIFPIHTGSLSVKMKLDPLVITMKKILATERGPITPLSNINEIYYAAGLGNSDIAKEHRENSEDGNNSNDELIEVEKEIENIFINRIKPDVQKQLKSLISSTVRRYFAQNPQSF